MLLYRRVQRCISLERSVSLFKVRLRVHVIAFVDERLRFIPTKGLCHRHRNKHYVDGQNATHSTITVSVSKIKGAARQCYGDGVGVVRCDLTFNLFDVTCKQRHRTSLNPNLNGTKKGDIDGSCKRSVREVYGILMI